jgi:3-oxocholest-4-en-26-oate---CoA ligase
MPSDPRPGALHFATIWETIADQVPDVPALIQGDRTVTWGDFESRAARVAGALEAAGIQKGSSVALYMYNCPEYFEVFFGAIKVRAIPANVNYRYTGLELRALLASSEAKALFFDPSLAERVWPAVDGTSLRLLVQVGGETSAQIAPHGTSYEALLGSADPAARMERDSGDVFLSYTGGTTGLPKGVLYEIGRGIGTTVALRDLFLDQTTELGIVDFAVHRARSVSPIRSVPASPLMHSTGFTYASLPTLTAAGTVILLEERSFDAHELFRAVATHKPGLVAIVGDAFAVPMVRALDQATMAGQPYDTSSLSTICSAGTAWTARVKERLLEHIPQVSLFDSCGCTEGVTYGRRRTKKGETASTSNFEAAPELLVVSPTGEALPAGEIGFLCGPTPAAGYFKDPTRTESVFFELNGYTYARPGDLGRIEPDGTVTLIGRGSSVVNTGGEKVYPAEVEETIRQINGVDDCVVLGVPDERFGQVVAALVACDDGTPLEEPDVTSAVRRALAGYKVPRVVRFVDAVPRSANGKVDYEVAENIAAGRA